jgi:GNAT superfamily N-acetyltransferase
MDKTEVEIRPLTTHDLNDWLPLWREYQEFYKVQILEEVTLVTWSRLLDPAEPMAGALAWVANEAVGMVHAIRHRSCWTIGDHTYLQDLFVAPRCRGAGIGRRLIEHVYAAAESQGCSRVYWLTHETNQVAMLLYDRIAQKSGFLQYRKTLAAK